MENTYQKSMKNMMCEQCWGLFRTCRHKTTELGKFLKFKIEPGKHLKFKLE